MDGLNFSPRNMQQLANAALKDAKAVTLTTNDGDTLSVNAPVELGTECISFRTGDSERFGITIVPYSAINRIHVS